MLLKPPLPVGPTLIFATAKSYIMYVSYDHPKSIYMSFYSPRMRQKIRKPILPHMTAMKKMAMAM